MQEPIPPSADADVIALDLGAFADPGAQVIRLDLASEGSAARLEAIQSELRREESRGWCAILHMTAEIAVVRWTDSFIIQITDPVTVSLLGLDESSEE